jgi:putative Mg2+ transporter-C (MgtC) family protein
MTPPPPSEVLTSLFAAGLLAGLLGLDRQIHGRWAGLRTHIVVSLGCCILVLAGTALDDPEKGRIGRIIQGIAAGIGFIGAGTILKLPAQDRVKGLTTASSVWLAAAVGTACGLHLYALAAAGTLLTLVVLIGFGWAERRFGEQRTQPPPEHDGEAGPSRQAAQTDSPWRSTSGAAGSSRTSRRPSAP